jgi:hypothetical protein
MLPPKISKQKRIVSPPNNKSKQILRNDELLILINKLSNLFKNFTTILKNNIAKKKDMISFIDKNIQFAHKIVNNIYKHNYSFEQLKSLNDFLVQINIKTNGTRKNVQDEEQNLKQFLEESDTLLNEINIKYKNNIKKYYKNQNLQSSNQRKYEYNLALQSKSLSVNIKRNQSEDKNKQGNITMNYTQRNNTNRNENNDLYDKMINTSDSYRYNGNSFTGIINKFHEKNNDSNNIILFSPNKAKSIYNINLNSGKKINKNLINEKIYSKSEFSMKKNININKEKSHINLQRNNLEIKNELNSTNTHTSKLSRDFARNNKIKNLKLYCNPFKIKEINNRNLYSGYLVNSNSKNEEKEKEKEKNNTFFSFNTQENSNKFFNNSVNLFQKDNDMKNIKQEKIKMDVFIKEKINKLKLLKKENIIVNKKNIELITKIKDLENIINKLNDDLQNEINKNNVLNNLCKKQKNIIEYKISLLNDKRSELSKLLIKKNNEITELQKEIIIKNKEIEEYKSSMTKNIENKDNCKKLKEHYETVINEKNKKVLELNGMINKCKKERNILFNENEDNKVKIKNLNNSLNQYEKELEKKNEEINKIQIINNNNKININNLNNIDMANTEAELNKLKKENENINQEIKQLKEENEGLKEFAIKIKDKDEKITEENINYKEKISILQKENNEYKQYFKDKKNNSEKNGENYINIISELNEAKKEIKNVKKKNEELFNELESAKFVNHYHDNHSEGKALSNYEEEFD